MNGVSRLTAQDNIMLVSIKDAGASLMSSTLTDLAEAGVVVDMISQTPPVGSTFSFSFTASYDDFDRALKAIGTAKQGHHGNLPMISGGYAKVNLFGEEMADRVGVAAQALAALCAAEVDIAMITTSDLDISLLVRSEDADVAGQKLTEVVAL